MDSEGPDQHVPLHSLIMVFTLLTKSMDTVEYITIIYICKSDQGLHCFRIKSQDAE